MVTTETVPESATSAFDFEGSSRPGPTLARNIGAWTTREAALVLGVNINTVRIWVASGRLSSIKLGNQRFIPHRALLDYFWTALENPDTREGTIRLLESHATTLGKECDVRALFAESQREREAQA